MSEPQGGLLPPRGDDDTIPVKLSEGSFWVPAEAVRRYGLDFLNKFNTP